MTAHQSAALAACLASALLVFGCRRQTEEQKSSAARDSTSHGAVPDTALSPESAPLAVRFITWPDSLTPQPGEFPSSLRWNFFDTASEQRLTPAQLNTLTREGFFVQEIPPAHVSIDDMVDRYSELYVFNYGQSYSTIPVFLSSDFLLHVFHVVFDRMFQSIEQKRLLPVLEQLTASLLRESTGQARGASSPMVRAAARRNLAFLSVAAKLLNDTASVPEEARELAQWELKLVNDASGIEFSPLTQSPEDYSQYRPRGHYTINADLTRYFRAMMWYGRRSFSAESDTLTLQALLFTRALEKPEDRILWEKLYMPTAFVAGPSDDPTLIEYSRLTSAVYGSQPDPAQLADTSRLRQFMEEVHRLPGPTIAGIPSRGTSQGAPAHREFRLMGQRAVPDAYIFTSLTSPRVGTDEHPRNMPTVLDVMSVLGSPVADELVQPFSAIPGYAGQLERVKSEFNDYPPALWRSDLYWSWLNTLRPLLQDKGPGYPYFMRGRKWATKGLMTAVGSWTELKHDTFLLSKQSYAEMGEGEDEEIPKPPPQPRSYVEPDIEFFNRLIFLVDRTRNAFAGLGLLTAEYEKKFGILFDQLVALRSIVQKELLDAGLTVEEYDTMLLFAQKIGGIILPEEAGDIIEEKYKQMALVTDTHTDSFPTEMKVLEDAVGAPQRIYVGVKDNSGGCRICVGYVYSVYEFTQPLGNRLTDEEWRALVYAKNRRPLAQKEPAWARGLRTLTAH